jgi:TetR/AcrR family transcriptional repressor of nem operon
MTLGTRELLLMEAEALVRTRGFAAFSYADLSSRVGIQKASIHHHFPTKEALGEALIDGYLVKFEAALQAVLDQDTKAGKRIRRYAEFFSRSMHEGMLPLCGALSAELSALPKSMQMRVRHFFALHLKWLEQVVRAGVAAGELPAGTDVARAALLILSTLEGASLVAWATGDAKAVRRTIDDLVALLERETSKTKPQAARKLSASRPV